MSKAKLTTSTNSKPVSFNLKLNAAFWLKRSKHEKSNLVGGISIHSPASIFKVALL